MPTHPLHSQAVMAKEYAFFTYFEAFVVIVFTFEYILRTWAAPKRGAHVREVMNVIDLCAFLPWYLEVLIAVAVPSDFHPVHVEVLADLVVLAVVVVVVLVVLVVL